MATFLEHMSSFDSRKTANICQVLTLERQLQPNFPTPAGNPLLKVGLGTGLLKSNLNLD